MNALRFLAALGLPACVAAAQATLELLPPATAGGNPRARATAPPGTEWVALFFRRAGEQEFETVSLDVGADGTYGAEIQGLLPPGVQVEYYGAVRTASGLVYTPAGAPAKLSSLLLPGTAPAAPGPAAPVPPPPANLGQLHADGSLQDLLHRDLDVPNEPKLQGSGQVRYTYRTDEGDRHFLLNTRAVYTNQPAPGQPRWGVGEFQAQFASGAHRVMAGDFTTQETEYTLSGGGRRGLDYTYSAQPTAHLFAVNTERETGTRGLAWPVAGSEAYGGALALDWLGRSLKTKVVFLSGKDDPSSASNAVFLGSPVREGSTGSLAVDGRFLDSRLAFSGEYARSLFTRNVEAAPKETDQAWRLAGQWTQGAFTAHAGYHDIGRDFGTVGVAFFVGDRRVLDASAGLAYAKWGLTATAVDERTNPQGQAGAAAWNRTEGLDARIVLAPWASWRLGVRMARQEAEVIASPLIPFSDSQRQGAGTGLDLVVGPGSSLTFNVQFDRLRSTGSTESTGTSTAVSAGGSLAPAPWARITPSLSWTRTRSEPGDQLMTSSNAFLNAEFILVPRTLGFLLNGGASRTELMRGTALTTSVAEGTLAWTLDAWFRNRARGSLGLKGRYARNPVLTGVTQDNRLYLLLNLSY